MAAQPTGEALRPSAVFYPVSDTFALTVSVGGALAHKSRSPVTSEMPSRSPQDERLIDDRWKCRFAWVQPLVLRQLWGVVV